MAHSHINSALLAHIKQEEESSETELSDLGSESSDNDLGFVKTNSSDESTSSSSDEEDVSLSDTTTNFVGRDKVTEWKKLNYSKVKRPARIKLSECSKPRRNGVGAKTLMQAWNLFISEGIVEKIVKHTNEFIEKKSKSYERQRDCKATDGEEIRALFGLLYIAGALKISHINLGEIYATDGTGIPIFPTTMALRRFKFLLNALRFESETTKESQRILDKAAPFRDILETFTQNCLIPYSVGQNVVIHELFSNFKGKCPFKQYITSKSDQTGIKLYSLVDVGSSYVLNIELDAFNQPEGPYKLSNAPEDVVRRLITPISGTGRILTINEKYTSVPFVNELAENHKIHVVGNLDKNQKEIPVCFTNKNRPQFSSQFGFSDKATLVTYVPKRKKSVVLISTLHSAAEIVENTDDNKPNILAFYNHTKSGADDLDRKINMYSTSWKNSRWTLTLFFRLLDIAGINAMVLLKRNKVTIDNRQRFLRKLGIELTKEHVQWRSTVMNLPRELKKRIREHLNINDSNEYDEPCTSSSTSRASCKICPSKLRRQSKTQCRLCHRNICRAHTKFICKQCCSDDMDGHSDEFEGN